MGVDHVSDGTMPYPGVVWPTDVRALPKRVGHSARLIHGRGPFMVLDSCRHKTNACSSNEAERTRQSNITGLVGSYGPNNGTVLKSKDTSDVKLDNIRG